MNRIKILYMQITILFNFSLCEHKKIDVNVFVHGTIKPYLKMRNIATIINQNDVKNSPYATFNNFMRKSSFLRKYQAVQGLGLKEINLSKTESGNGAVAIATLYNFFDDPKQDKLFYTYGWSGLLSHKEREQAGITLYNQIEQLVRRLESKGYAPEINIITYSHGGTVALNMAKTNKTDSFKVNLITFGMPVQKDTDYLINSPLFKKIYHFYSTSDYIQTIDHASSEYFACHRQFHPRKNFSIPNKLIQIQIGVIKTVLNQCFCRKKCSNKKILIKKSYNQNPGHGELWILGWSPSGYRKDYPIYPIPIVAFTPTILKYINKLIINNNHIKVDINPRLEQLVVKIDKNTYIKPLIKFNSLKYIKDQITEEFSPNTDLKRLKAKTRKAAQIHAFFKHDPCNLRCFK
jgi:hypothetical protein